MFTADQLVAHAVGDYVLQSDWMANEKTKRSVAAVVHALCYTIPFVFLTWSWQALLVVTVTHFVIDRWRLARFVCWVKNFLSPRRTETPLDMFGGSDISLWWHPWAECSGTGYHSSRPPWMAVWLMIIADNVMHVTINALALRYL